MQVGRARLPCLGLARPADGAGTPAAVLDVVGDRPGPAATFAASIAQPDRHQLRSRTAATQCRTRPVVYCDTVHQLRTHCSPGAIVSAMVVLGPRSGSRYQSGGRDLLDRISVSSTVWSTPNDQPAGARTGPRLRVDFQHPHRTAHFLRRPLGRGCKYGGDRRRSRWAESFSRMLLVGAISTLRLPGPHDRLPWPGAGLGATCCGSNRCSTTSSTRYPKDCRTGPMGRGSPTSLSDLVAAKACSYTIH